MPIIDTMKGMGKLRNLKSWLTKNLRISLKSVRQVRLFAVNNRSRFFIVISAMLITGAVFGVAMIWLFSSLAQPKTKTGNSTVSHGTVVSKVGSGQPTVAVNNSSPSKPVTSSSSSAPVASANPTPNPTTAASTPTTPLPIYPSGVLNLANWKLTLPTDVMDPGSPDEISQPSLASFNDNPYFYVDSARDGVVFQAPVGGTPTSGSDYPRSELREMTDNGSQQASWSSTSGTSTMTVEEAITHLPVVRPQLVAAQVHGPSDYVMLVRLNGSDLFVENNGNNVGTLNANYSLGTVFTVQIVVNNGYIQVFYNGNQKADFASKGSGYYFKAGSYTQSNPSDGDSPSAYGQVIIYNLQVSHT